MLSLRAYVLNVNDTWNYYRSLLYGANKSRKELREKTKKRVLYRNLKYGRTLDLLAYSEVYSPQRQLSK